MFEINRETLDICLSYANTLSIEFLVEPKDNHGPLSPEADKATVCIRDLDGEDVFHKDFDVISTPSHKEDVVTFIFKLSHEDSKTILPGDYTWDFTYWHRAKISDDPELYDDEWTTVWTPFCDRSPAIFKVMSTNSTAPTPHLGDEPEEG